MRFIIGVFVILSALFFTSGTTATGAQDPKPPDRKAPPPALGTPLATLTGLASVELYSLSIDRSNPTECQAVKFRINVRNRTAVEASRIPWQIAIDGNIFRSGAREKVAPNGSFDEEVTWIATPGRHYVSARVDPQNTLNEPQSERANNTRDLDLDVPASPDLVADELFVSAAPPFNHPTATRTLQIKATIRNPGNTGVTNIPWRIKAGDNVLKDSRESIGAGRSFQVTTQWTPSQEGTYNFSLEVDPVPGEAACKQRNNKRLLAVTVLALDERILSIPPAPVGYNVFHIGVVQDSRPSACYPPRPGPNFVLDCSYSPLGLKVDAEEWKGFTLKNDWRVKGIAVEHKGTTRVGDNRTAGEGYSYSETGYRIDVRPATGSDNPYTKLRVWSAGGWRTEIWVKITIEGPRVKNPYQ
jgi:hypothetical protein